MKLEIERPHHHARLKGTAYSPTWQEGLFLFAMLIISGTGFFLSLSLLFS